MKELVGMSHLITGTLVTLQQNLLEKKITFIRILMEDMKDIPPEFQANKNREME
jgi:hypothetical protein